MENTKGVIQSEYIDPDVCLIKGMSTSLNEENKSIRFHYLGVESSVKSPANEDEHKIPKFLTKQKTELSNTDKQSVFTFNREVTTSSVDLENFTNDIKKKTISKKLRITNISGRLFKGEELIINNYGLEYKNKPRQVYHCFFGDKRSIKSDYELNVDSLKDNNYLFEIFYQKNLRRYILKTKIQISVLINKPFLLERNVNYDFLVGNTCVGMTLYNYENDVVIKLKINNENELEFQKDSLPLTIGRNKTSIKIDKPGISKRHAIIEYREMDDTYFLRDLESTNGTQLLLAPEDSFMIGQDNVLKFGENIFEISEFFSH